MKRISRNLTQFKLGVPVAAGLFVAYWAHGAFASMSVFSRSDSWMVDGLVVVIAAGFGIAAGSTLAMCSPVRGWHERVFDADDRLVVFRKGREIDVPLIAIRSISIRVWTTPKVELRLEKGSELGRSVIFMPRIRASKLRVYRSTFIDRIRAAKSALDNTARNTEPPLNGPLSRL